MQTASRKVINGWAMYDWANSVYSLVITSSVFPSYYEAVTSGKTVKYLGRNFTEPTALYDYAVAFSFLIVACFSPLLSSIADAFGNKKRFMQFFCYLGSVSCCAMYWFAPDDPQLGISLFIIASIGFGASLVFYNAYLPEIAAEKDQDSVSARGFAFGYIGSVILLIICLVMISRPSWFGIADETKASQISFLLTGLWWMGFAQFTFSVLPKSMPNPVSRSHNVFTRGYAELRKVWNELKEQNTLKRFLLAFFFFGMGVETVMYSAAIFAKHLIFPKTGNKEVDAANSGKLILTILIIQLVAIAGSYMFSYFSGKIGNFKVLIIGVIIWTGICIWAYFVYTEIPFYCLAGTVGLVMGGIQSLSRSTYSKLMPPTKDTASYFSFYDVCDKVSTVIGMVTFGLATEGLGGMRNAVLFIMTYFIIAFFILLSTIAKQRKPQLAL
ncbi:MAG TPA: MFS transporter [Chitinophagaceae bacterium]|nr:MFS transporter [Chitinophagaceae bacterium]